MNVQEYFADLEDVVTDALLLTGGPERLTEEIRHNCWHIGLPAELAAAVRVADFEHWLRRVKQNRQDQLRQQSAADALRYYLWVDYQSGYLCFNFLSNCHEQLPFSAPVEPVESEAVILADFLRFCASDDYDAPNTMEQWRVRTYSEVLRR
ncbi:hypothetical protein [Hymenobacter edaphi]|uniref:Uncharacterized protein n=1 Tax=Hymenobacter edaphi TaxID=2211146 RepID=A0A328BCY1_9BACT|nr:hypothetical protein [Hymenobacter edaphi]RAK62928.1 hypothetical protein DLM85_22270 [Hymenobacter edaphi]